MSQCRPHRTPRGTNRTACRTHALRAAIRSRAARSAVLRPSLQPPVMAPGCARQKSQSQATSLRREGSGSAGKCQRVVTGTIRPAGSNVESTSAQLFVQGAKLELDTDLCQHLRAARKEPLEVDGPQLRADVTGGTQPHLDPVLFHVPPSDVREVVNVESFAVQLPPQDLDQVQVERGGHS